MKPKKQIDGDYLLLKWGTLKGWQLKNSPEAFAAPEKWNALGSSFSAAMQTDTPEQKELICKIIETVNGPVSNDWDDFTYKDLDKAKEYVMNYGKEKAKVVD